MSGLWLLLLRKGSQVGGTTASYSWPVVVATELFVFSPQSLVPGFALENHMGSEDGWRCGQDRKFCLCLNEDLIIFHICLFMGDNNTILQTQSR